MAFNGRALTATGLGVLFIWSGIKGWSVLATIGDVITGRQPNEPVSYPIEIRSQATPGITGSPSGIAGIAVQYVGHSYLFGGAPGRDGSQPWDCSSFINWIVSVKAGMAIPGNGPGRYDGTSHGPTTGTWAIWTGMTSIKRADVQAGDILVWAGHMGMALDNTRMISALNPTDKTKITVIDAGVGRGPLIRMGRL